MACFPHSELSIAFDLHGCPNRCRHCWLGCASTHSLDLAHAESLFQQFRQYVASGRERPHLQSVRFFGSWLREPDYSDDYRLLYDEELRLNNGADRRKDYELFSVWRLARDESYVRWAAANGVKRCQITLFGAEETTDWFYRRPGAFQDAVAATERLLEHRIVPRWQLIQTKRILPELPVLLSLADQHDLYRRARDAGGEFVIFMHDPTPTGEAEQIEHLRLVKEDLEAIPEELIRSTMKHMKLTDPYYTETEWLAQIHSESEGPLSFAWPDALWLYVDSHWDVYPNLVSLQPWWKLGNLRNDAPGTLIRKYTHDETPGQMALKVTSARDLARTEGDPHSERVYMSKNDLLQLYLERRLRKVVGQAR